MTYTSSIFPGTAYVSLQVITSSVTVSKVPANITVSMVLASVRGGVTPKTSNKYQNMGEAVITLQTIASHSHPGMLAELSFILMTLPNIISYQQGEDRK